MVADQGESERLEGNSTSSRVYGKCGTNECQQYRGYCGLICSQSFSFVSCVVPIIQYTVQTCKCIAQDSQDKPWYKLLNALVHTHTCMYVELRSWYRCATLCSISRDQWAHVCDPSAPCLKCAVSLFVPEELTLESPDPNPWPAKRHLSEETLTQLFVKLVCVCVCDCSQYVAGKFVFVFIKSDFSVSCC